MNKFSVNKLVGWSAIAIGILTAAMTAVTMKGRAIMPEQGMDWITDRTFIFIASGLMFFFGIWLLADVYGGKQEKETVGLSREAVKNIPVLIGVIVIYTMCVEKIGFLICTMMFVAFLAWFFGTRKPIVYVLLVAGTPAAIYIIFGYFLKVPLPGV